LIKITDLTLSCLDEYDASPEQLRKLCELLQCIGVDYTEMSVDAYKKIGNLPQNGNYILKLKYRDEIYKHDEFGRFVCRHSGYAVPANVISEIQANDIREINSLRQYNMLENVRITGFDDILSHDYIQAFNSIKSIVKGKIELCPEDKYYCATAVAVEWIMQGGNFIAASFAGVGDKAALEEVLMALHLEKRHKPNISFSVFPEITQLIEEITGSKIPTYKAVIGDNIFAVEAGIHADGISKDPKIYEPFTPELVGSERKLVIGKHSGKTAILLKLKELNLYYENVDLQKLLSLSQEKSIEKLGSLTDAEFIELFYSVEKE